MLRFLVHRALQSLVVLALMSFAVYFLIGLMPGDPIDLMRSADPRMSAEDVTRLKQLYGVDRPLVARYLAWAGQALGGELGYSRLFAAPVSAVLLPRLGNSLLLMGSSFALAFALAPTLGTLAAWQGYAEAANMVGAAFRQAGIKYFFHPEQDWFRFFDDPAHPELARTHRIDWFTDNTDPRLVFFEPDTMHTLAGRGRFPDPVGTLFDHNRWFARLAQQRRLIAWHIKDADRRPQTAAGANPFVQEHQRPRFPLNGGVDVVYVGEGSIGKGYPCDIEPAVLGFPETFKRYPLSDPGWFHAESDNGPGPASDPGRSLRWAKVSARNLLSLRRHEARA